MSEQETGEQVIQTLIDRGIIVGDGNGKIKLTPLGLKIAEAKFGEKGESK